MELFLGIYQSRYFLFGKYLDDGRFCNSVYCAFCSKKNWFGNAIDSVPFAVTTIIILGVLTIGLGSINLGDQHSQGLAGKLGLDNITTTWYFAFIFFMTLVNLWLAILREPFFSKKNITFY